MHVAANHGKLHAIKALIDAGADVTAKNHGGLAPVLVAKDPGDLTL